MPEVSVQGKLKPGQPTQLWTFNNALLLLKSNDRNSLQSLDEFFLLHRSLMFNSNPFHQKNDKIKITKDTKEFTLHGVLYNGITPTNYEDSKLISEKLNLDQLECLRIICQTCKRNPVRKHSDFENHNTKLPDDRAVVMEQERLVLYASKILHERRLILECVLELMNKKLDSTSSSIQNLGKELFLSDKYINSIIETLKHCITNLNSEHSDFQSLMERENLLFISTCLRVLVEATFQNTNISHTTILNWFQFMHSNNFTNKLSPVISERESLALIDALCNIISIALLDVENIDCKIMNNGSLFKDINSIITNPSNLNAITMYGWLIIILRKSYIISETDDETFTKYVSLKDLEYSITFLSVKCKELNVFHEIDVVNNTLKFDNLYPAILSSIIIASMPLTTLTDEIASTIYNVMKNCPNVIIEKFFNNQATINAIIVARAKFPHLIIPFLKLASINGEFAFNEFKELKSYMYELPEFEFNQLSIIDDTNTELVKTTKLIDIYPPFEINKKLSLLMNYDTKAKILPSVRENFILATFLYRYNGFAFFGRVLQNLSNTFDANDNEKTTLIVSICELLTSILRDSDGQILDSLSAYTDNSDIVEVILRLLDQGLHSRSIKVSKTIIDLLYYLSPHISDRIWNYLSDSILLSDGGKEGFVSILFSAIEVVQGDYSFTISFIKLTEILAHDCLNLKPTTKIQTKSKVLSQCINHLILVFETFVHCKFNDSCQKMELGVLILDTFSNMLTMVYGLQKNDKSGGGKVSEVFIESAKNIIDSFLISKSDFSRTCYPLTVLIDSLEFDINLYELKDSTTYLYSSWIKGALEFTELIVSIRTSINYPPSTFETSIFSKLPILVKTYANHAELRKNILDLMTVLTSSSWPKDTRPSLLSHLGTNGTQILLQSLITDLDNDFDDYNIKVSIYDFVSAVMTGDQEGLSVLLLGVRDIVDNLTKEGSSKHDQSLIKVLKKNIKNIKYLPDSVALHLVDAMGLVINSWSSLHTLTEDDEFIDELINRIKIPVNEQPKLVDEYIENCYNLKLVSKIAEVLALYLFSSKNNKYIEKIGKFLTEFKKHMEGFFTIKSYHSKLHDDIEEQFSSHFKPFEVSDFKCSLVKRNRYGVSTIYNLTVMEGMFKFSPHWQQLKEKIIASSIELQYLSAQVDVAKSLSALITASVRKDSKVLNVDFIDFANHLLRTNIIEGLPAEFFQEIYNTRIQLAFFIIYNMYNLSTLRKDTKKSFELLKTCSELLKSDSMDFINNLTHSTGYYMSLLRIIYCTLVAVKDDKILLVEYFSIFRGLFELIVSKGTKVLIIEIQNEVYLSKTTRVESSKMSEKIDDIHLILSILKIFTEFKITINNQYELCEKIEETELIRSLLNLFSFAHLIEIDGEFIFAQLSLMFIQELMKFEIIARKLIDNGLFMVLTGSNISSTIKNGDINITTSPRYHKIWTNGILPIFVFTLSNLGPSILPDICLALGNFMKQIEYCIDSWSKDSSTIRISTATINETNQILILLQLLKSFDVTGFFGIKIDGEELNNIVDIPILPGLESEVKREDFMDHINNLLKHPKFLTSRILPSSNDEQRIIDAGGAPFDSFVNSVIEEISSLKEFV